MLLTKEVEIKINSNTADYYKTLGYKIPMKKATESYYKKYKKEFVYDFSKTIIVRVDDLMKQSNVEIKALCDYCNEEIVSMPYSRYNKTRENVDKIACDKCKSKKRADCNLLKYGVDNYAKTAECQEKMKNTIRSLYGVEHYSQTQEYKEKFHNTCINKYGDFYRQQFINKAFETYFNKTGFVNPMQSMEVRERMKESCIEHYGVDNPFKSSEIKEKIKQQYIEHYGVSNPAKSPEIREKITQTLYKNSTQKASRQQLYINNLYQGILNYPVKYYNVDIYLPNDNLIIEYDGGFHDGAIKTGNITQEEFKRKEIIRNNTIKKEGYKQMRIISLNDKLPSDAILLQMLSEARTYFFQYPNHSWIEFNISTSTIRNAENPQGIPYSFGTLRTIKDSDITTNNISIDKTIAIS